MRGGRKMVECGAKAGRGDSGTTSTGGVQGDKTLFDVRESVEPAAGADPITVIEGTDAIVSSSWA